ncbi:hypothetical protein EG329_006885 [Mollisiaceae sp. DMI_Dod_QoI]|nr:hypothetical protein EG329_006885 [Helotiales sp. DMI_Dod_QoI]
MDTLPKPRKQPVSYSVHRNITSMKLFAIYDTWVEYTAASHLIRIILRPFVRFLQGMGTIWQKKLLTVMAAHAVPLFMSTTSLSFMACLWLNPSCQRLGAEPCHQHHSCGIARSLRARRPMTDGATKWIIACREEEGPVRKKPSPDFQEKRRLCEAGAEGEGDGDESGRWRFPCGW